MFTVEIITAGDVILWLGLQPAQQDETLPGVVATVNVYVAGLPVIADAIAAAPPVEPPVPFVAPADVKQGAVMLAARLWRRRNSPAGVEAITEAGAQYVARYDPEISRLLRTEGFTAPAVG